MFANTKKRSAMLKGAVGAAEKFHNNFEITMDLLKDIRDDLAAQDSTGVEPEIVLIQKKQLQVIILSET